MSGESSDPLFQETERLKIRFVAAYERLYELGKITEEELEDVIDAIDRIDELSEEEFERRLGRFRDVGGHDSETGL